MIDPLLLAALYVAYRETVSRLGPSALLTRDWRRALRTYIRKGLLS